MNLYDLIVHKFMILEKKRKIVKSVGQKQIVQKFTKDIVQNHTVATNSPKK